MLRRVADIYNRFLLKLTLFIYYYIPILYSYIKPFQRRGDIHHAHPGVVSFPTGKYAIYVLWQPRTIPWYVVNMLEGLRDHQVNTIVVANHKLMTEQLTTLQGLCAEILVRGNRGYDFGAYKDAFLSLTQKEKGISRLLILNDSMYVFRRGLDSLLDELLAEKYEVVSAYENWELHYHFQSFCIGLAGNIVYDANIQDYWRRYRPISIRRWCIDFGEVKFSAVLRKVASNFRIVFGINELLNVLTSKVDVPTILQYREFVPAPVRGYFPSDETLPELESHRDNRKLIMRRLKEALSHMLALRAQIHTGTFLFPKFLSSPLIKRDIVYRELFTIYEVDRMLLELGYHTERQSILDELRRRGTAAHLKGFTKRRYQLGLI